MRQIIGRSWRLHSDPRRTTDNLGNGELVTEDCGGYGRDQAKKENGRPSLRPKAGLNDRVDPSPDRLLGATDPARVGHVMSEIY